MPESSIYHYLKYSAQFYLKCPDHITHVTLMIHLSYNILKTGCS